jgi:arginyl-tRNA synthetase
MNLFKTVSESIKDALGKMPELADADLSAVSVEVPKNRDHGDFATNAAMVLSKQLGKNPRAVAEMILPVLSDLDFADSISIAGPGFINIKLKDEFIINEINNSSLLTPHSSLTIDLDYGSYNVAKSLHVGHFRGSISGDTLRRIGDYLGHKIISYNYIGDWGRPMGLVIAYIESLHPDWPFFQKDFDPKGDYSAYTISQADLDVMYPAASARGNADPDFLARAQKITAEFQKGHPGYTALYEIFLKTSLAMMDDIIARLGMLPFDRTLGERNAAKYLPEVEKILREKNLLIKDDGAEIVEVKRDDDTAPMPPFIFSNSRGGDTYGGTDLATIYLRKMTDNPDKLLYLNDLRQSLHHQQVFRVAEMAGIANMSMLEHIPYGTINGADGKPYKTRDGNAAGLLDIIGMIDSAAAARVAESGKDLPAETVKMISLAAIRFNELSHDFRQDYVFDPDQVTKFEGRTGPYIIYTAVRLNSVLKKAKEAPPRQASPDTPLLRVGDASDLALSHATPIGRGCPGGASAELNSIERSLLLHSLDFDRIVVRAFELRSPDVLANWTYDFAQLINTFYHDCPILRDDVSAEVREHRLGIVTKSSEILAKAIDLMGMKVPEEM